MRKIAILVLLFVCVSGLPLFVDAKAPALDKPITKNNTQTHNSPHVNFKGVITAISDTGYTIEVSQPKTKDTPKLNKQGKVRKIKPESAVTGSILVKKRDLGWTNPNNTNSNKNNSSLGQRRGVVLKVGDSVNINGQLENGVVINANIHLVKDKTNNKKSEKILEKNTNQ